MEFILMATQEEKPTWPQFSTDVRFFLPPQPVDATHALNLSAGVSNFNVLRGRSFN